MQDATSSGGNASQPDVYLGSQSDIGQLVGTSTVTWPPVSAIIPNNPYTNLIAGSAGPNVSNTAPAAHQGALSRPVQPGHLTLPQAHTTQTEEGCWPLVPAGG